MFYVIEFEDVEGSTNLYLILTLKTQFVQVRPAWSLLFGTQSALGANIQEFVTHPTPSCRLLI